jgi:hypothetical protein
MQKQEVFRFLTLVEEQHWQQALNLVEYCGTADLSFNSGILNSILSKAERMRVPPEWIADEELHDLKPLQDGDQKSSAINLPHHAKPSSKPSTFVIHKDALK